MLRFFLNVKQRLRIKKFFSIYTVPGISGPVTCVVVTQLKIFASSQFSSCAFSIRSSFEIATSENTNLPVTKRRVPDTLYWFFFELQNELNMFFSIGIILHIWRYLSLCTFTTDRWPTSDSLSITPLASHYHLYERCVYQVYQMYEDVCNN